MRTGTKINMVLFYLTLSLSTPSLLSSTDTIAVNSDGTEDHDAQSSEQNGPVSSWDYEDIRGQRGNFSDHRGRWIIINYWAIWCSPCIKEIPELNKFAMLHSADAVVFGVDYDQTTAAELVENANKLNIQFPVLTDDPAALLALPIPQNLPVTYLINPAGQFTRTLVGPQTLATLEQAIK